MTRSITSHLLFSFSFSFPRSCISLCNHHLLQRARPSKGSCHMALYTLFTLEHFFFSHSCLHLAPFLLSLSTNMCKRSLFRGFSLLPSWVNPGWQLYGPKTSGHRVYIERERADVYTQLTDRWAMKKGLKRMGDVWNVWGCHSPPHACSQVQFRTRRRKGRAQRIKKDKYYQLVLLPKCGMNAFYHPLERAVVTEMVTLV